MPRAIQWFTHAIPLRYYNDVIRGVFLKGSGLDVLWRSDRPDFMGMESGEDSGVDLLFFFDERQSPSGLFLNVACPSQVMEATYLVSADFMGALREKLKGEFGSQFLTLCQVSAAGCQSPRDLVRRYRDEADFWHADGVEILSERLLQAVKRAYRGAAASIQAQPVFKHENRTLALPRRKVSQAEYEAAQEKLGQLLHLQNEFF